MRSFCILRSAFCILYSAFYILTKVIIITCTSFFIVL